MSATGPLACRLDDALREAPLDAAAFAREADRLADAIGSARSQPRELLDRLGEATPVLRIAGRLDEARRAASAAVALADLLEDPRAAFENQVRLAHVMQWEKRFDLATAWFDRLEAQARSMALFRDLLPAVLEHAGRNLFDQGRHAQAAQRFREALALRQAAGDPDAAEIAARSLQCALVAEREAEGRADC